MSTSSLPYPVTNEEHYLAKIAGMDVPLPDEDVTNTDAYLREIAINGGGGGGGTSNYNDLTNRPQINGTTLSGNKTASDLGLVSAVSGKALSSNDFTDAYKSKLEGVEANANKTVVDNSITQSSANPVKSSAIYTALADKVDKVDGKGLSSNDYTDDEKSKLSGIEAGAEANVNADWEAESGDAQILHKPTLGTAASHDVASAIGDTTDIPTAAQVNTALAGKQDTLKTAQQAAVDSGITAAKVSTYDGYATSKLSAADVFGRGTQIPKDTDLDDFKAIGRYYSGDSTRTNSLANKPFSNTGFDLEVRQSYQSQSSTDGINQIAYTIIGGVFTVKVRTYRYSGSPAAWAWNEWQTLAFTAAT